METGFSWDTGLARSLNEDSIFCAVFDLKTHAGILSAALFAVADGMGGHSAGEVASDLAIKTFHAECFSRLLNASPVSFINVMAESFSIANQKVLEVAHEKSLNGMGTTLTAALIVGQDIYVAHVGDSRCYIINTRETLQITRDHSTVQSLVDADIITADEALKHPRRNEITRALGYLPDTKPDLYHVKLYAGDNILLCSDGLCGVLTADLITDTVLKSAGADQACNELTALANQAGGPDNISVIVVKPGNLPSWQAMIAAGTGVRTVK